MPINKEINRKIIDIRNIVMKVIAEGKFGQLDIKDASEIGTKYKKFIDGVIKANNFGSYHGYSYNSKELTIYGQTGLIVFNTDTMKPIRATKIWK